MSTEEQLTQKMQKRFKAVADEDRLFLAEIKRRDRAISIAVVVALMAAALLFLGATTKTAHRFTETAVSNGDGDWQYLKGTFTVQIYGTFDSATVDVETLVEGTTTSPTVVSDISVPDLIGVTSLSPWATLTAGDGYYRIEVSGGLGSESISWQVRDTQ
jgi:hypothetical protein